MLELLLAADFAVGHAGRPFLAPDVLGVVERDQDALQAVGQFDGHRVERGAAHLLEVGELGDLLAVEPDFPAQAPGRDGGLLPVVFHEADVVLARVDADGLERVEVEFLRLAAA